MSDPLDQDFVVDARGVKTSKIPPIIDFDGRKTRVTREKSRERHNMLRQLRVLVNSVNEANEKTLAEACGTDINNKDWIESIENLDSRGYVCHIRTEWDGVRAYAFVKLAEPMVRLLPTGAFFGTMSFEQCMQVAGER